MLDIVANTESPSFSKKAAVQLLGKMGEASFESQQIVVQQGGIDVLMETMQNGDDREVMFAATQAMKCLSKRVFRDQGAGTIPRLVQILETSATQRKSTTPGLVPVHASTRTHTVLTHLCCVDERVCPDLPADDTKPLLFPDQWRPFRRL